MQKFFIKTLGCKTNRIESEIMRQNLLEAGFLAARKIEDANFYILNSCTVTSHTESQAHYLLSYARRKNPRIKTVLCGCMAQVGGNGADIVLGNKEKLEIAGHLKKSSVQDIFKENKFDFRLIKNPDMTRPSVKIQDGCNNRCAYCIIPYARGASRSANVDDIIKQINLLISCGIKEVVLTGIHIGLWGQEWGFSLIDLLKNIEKTDILRYRLGSLYVNEITPELLEFLKKSNKFCAHFHLSLQSMCDKTLAAMGRNYNVKKALNVIEKLHSTFKIPPFLGCDIIVGFPNETDEDFETTYKNLKQAKLSKIHVFPYSRRKGTLADKMQGQIQNSVKSARAKKLMALSEELYKKFIEANLEVEHEALFEKKPANKNLNCAITRNYIKVFVKDEAGDSDLRGQIRTLKLKDAFKIENPV